jgi:hypothetical protein
MPVRTRRVELDGDYAGWWIDVRINAPMGILEELDAAKKAAEVYEILTRIFPGPSNFVDDDGAPIDLAQPGGWAKIGADLVAESLRRFREEAHSPLAKSAAKSSSPLSSATAEPSPPATPT